MALDFSDATGNLFNRLGKIGYLFNSILAFYGPTTARNASGGGLFWPTSLVPEYNGPQLASFNSLTDALAAQFDGDDDADLLDGFYAARNAQRDAQSMLAYLQGLFQRTIIRMVDDDVRLISATLPLALEELIRQMKAASYKVDGGGSSGATITVAEACPAPNGDPAFAVTITDPHGFARDYFLSEQIDFVCSTDSQQGGTLGQEQFDWTGDAAESNPLSWNWGLDYFRDTANGSGQSGSLTAMDASTSDNLLTNGDFESFSTNTPASWTLLGGTGAGGGGAAGTNIFAAGAGYKGSNAIKFTGTATAVLNQIYQALDLTRLKPLTMYAFNCWAKKSSLSEIASVLTFSLTDGSGTVITNAAGTANTITKLSNAIGTAQKVTNYVLSVDSSTWAADDIIRVTITDSKNPETSRTADITTGTTTLNTVASNFATAWNALTLPEFAEITATSSSATITLTNDRVGRDFGVTLTPLQSNGSTPSTHGRIDLGTGAAAGSIATAASTGTSYAPVTGFFQTPAVLPSEIRFRIKFTTDPTSTYSIYLDELALIEATELYQGGPFAAIFSGATKTVVGDRNIVTARNAKPLPYWPATLERLLGLRSLGLQIESATGLNTIAQQLLGNPSE
jgi:hypothetical protein